MYIEFKCSSCNKLLKTPPQTAGKTGKCPHCGSTMKIPLQSTAQSSQAPVRPAPAGPPLGDSSGLTPLDSSGLTPLGAAPSGGVGDLLDDLPALAPVGDAQSNPFGAAGGTTLRPGPLASNPYASPSLAASPAPRKQGGRAAAKSLVLGPAIGLIVYASLALIVYIANLAVMLATGGIAPPPNMNEAERIGYVVGFYGVLAISPIIFLMILAGGIMMMNLKAYGLAITACVMSFLPCSLCCLLGIPLGIWGLVVLNNEKVKRAFG